MDRATPRGPSVTTQVALTHRTVQFEPLEARRLLSVSAATLVATLPPSIPAAQMTVPLAATAEPINAVAGQPFTRELGVVSGLSKRKLHANINWGDGTPVTRGFISTDASGNLHVHGTHSYARGGTFPITVKLWRGEHRGVLVEQFQTTANVVQNSVTLQPAAGQPFTTTVGSFVPPTGGLDMPQALIQWGDGQFSQGTIQPNPRGGQDVVGTHTYARPGFYRITSFVTEGNEFSMRHVATLNSFADVGGVVPSSSNSQMMIASMLMG